MAWRLRYWRVGRSIRVGGVGVRVGVGVATSAVATTSAVICVVRVRTGGNTRGHSSRYVPVNGPLFVFGPTVKWPSIWLFTVETMGSLMILV